MQVELQESLLPRRTPSGWSFGRSAFVVIGSILLVSSAAAACMLTLLPSMGALGMLAYSFGCRHGVDADHIAVIDNATRQQLGAGRSSTTVGLCFSLGHCTIVFLLCALVLCTADASSSGAALFGVPLSTWTAYGAAVGPWVAASVLLCIGTVNLCAARGLFAQWRERRARGHAHEIAALATACCPRLLGVLDSPWKVFFVGVLFGLGLDTAAEICLLTLTALAQGAPRAGTLLLPLLFAAGMGLVDSANALLMLWAYEWASDHGPRHRLFFALVLTLASALLALAVGAVLAIGALGDRLGQCDGTGAPAAASDAPREGGPPGALDGAPSLSGFWPTACWLADNMELLGLASVGLFFAAVCTALLAARRCVTSQKEIERDHKEQLQQSLQGYLHKGAYIVRFE